MASTHGTRALRPLPKPIAHRTALAVASGLALGASYYVASQRPVPPSELSLAQRMNDVPDAVAALLYPIMQLGNAVAPVAVGLGMAAYRRHWFRPTATAAAGLTAWLVAKGIKAIVERDRPLAYIPDIIVREGEGGGLGYISGHSAVAAATALVALTVAPRSARPIAAIAVGLVGLARIVYGVHLPADVVGGWAVGTLLGLAAVVAVEHFSAAVGDR